ncbi:hypothetical protein RO575_14735 [Methylomonas sp. MO1]|uniref:hypothetical protein n=1 Tax=Methylomonas sp. MO1 TaxID=3073619 RepID=UPI0028A5460A|nr:hypothetical protein [Methylomonas sp. MO1]MDT4290819.1 hypothetical protein [Methylomonas sp. MO1]
MKSNWTICLLIALSLQQIAYAEYDFPLGTNCSLKKPPENAGEYLIHGRVNKVYPRAKDIDATYNGCQIAWSPVENGWEIFGIEHFTDGYSDRIWGPSNSGIRLRDCIYQKGLLLQGNLRSCHSKSQPMPSMPSGCAKRKQGDGHLPQDCRYE